MFCCFRTSAGLVSLLAVILGHLDSSSLLSNRGRGSSSRGGSNWDAADKVGEGSVVGDVLDGGGGDDSLGQQLGGGGNTDGGDGVGVHLGHRVGHRGDRWHALHLHRLGSLHSNWGSSVDVVVGNGATAVFTAATGWETTWGTV